MPAGAMDGTRSHDRSRTPRAKKKKPALAMEGSAGVKWRG
jgi:hypothetical protein